MDRRGGAQRGADRQKEFRLWSGESKIGECGNAAGADELTDFHSPIATQGTTLGGGYAPMSGGYVVDGEGGWHDGIRRRYLLGALPRAERGVDGDRYADGNVSEIL